MVKYSATITSECSKHGLHETHVFGWDPTAWCDAHNLFLVIQRQHERGLTAGGAPSILYIKNERVVREDDASTEFFDYQASAL